MMANLGTSTCVLREACEFTNTNMSTHTADKGQPDQIQNQDAFSSAHTHAQRSAHDQQFQVTGKTHRGQHSLKHAHVRAHVHTHPQCTHTYKGHMRTRPHADTRVQHRRAPTPQSSPRTQHLLQSRYPGYNLGRIDARTSPNSLTTTCPSRRHCSPALETCEKCLRRGYELCEMCECLGGGLVQLFFQSSQMARGHVTVLVLAEVVPGNCVARAKR